MLNNHKEFWWGLGGFGLFLVVFFVLAALGWPGAPDSCLADVPNTCWCEAIQTGALVKQPTNTWSNLGFVVSGLLILWQVGGDRTAPPPRANPMTRATAYAIALGAIVIFLGPGSMFFHGSMTNWGGWVDTYSLSLFGSFGLLYALTRIFHWSGSLFLGLYLAVNGGVGVITWLVDGLGTPLFAVMVAGWVITELVIVRWSPGGVQRQWPWLAAALGTFALALLIWSLSQTGRPLCDPASWFQGHGVWHLLTAVTTGCMFIYLRTET
jgi:hypothetical protein